MPGGGRREPPRGPGGDQAVVTPPSRAPEAVVGALAAFPEEVARALKDRPREALLRPTRDGGWGVVEILPHLRDWEEIFLARVEAILTEDRPHLPSFDDELWAIERDYRSQDPHATLAHFRELRGRLVDLVVGLPPEDWERLADHAVYGEITLHWMLDHVCDHDAEHLEQIRDALG